MVWHAPCKRNRQDMGEISKTTRESLNLGLHNTLPSSFRCFKLDSYSEMFFEEGRHLTRVLGWRCRWQRTLEYTFLVSVGVTPKNSAPNISHVAYLKWSGQIIKDGISKTVEATDDNLDGLLDSAGKESEAIIAIAQRAYQSALIASGLMPLGLSVKFLWGVSRARSAGSANFRRALDTKEPRVVEIRSQ